MTKDLYMGIDVGSLSTDGVLIDAQERIVYSVILPTGASIAKTIQRCREEILKSDSSVPTRLAKTISTGYGRKRVEFADEAITEITAHALGAAFQFPGAGTVIDIGGQDTKVIALSEEGGVSNFLMNDKCAAGTGRFLEVMARILEMDLDELSDAALNAEKTVPFTSTCTVFIESEIISSIADGIPPDVIAASVFRSIVERILSMVKEAGGKPPFVLTGGVAKNKAMVETIRKILPGNIFVPDDPQINGALGAALYAFRKS